LVNIGRADYNDIVIADPSVSTTHAKLQRKDGVWVLTDLGSTNGTYVEGEPVTGETALTPGTTLKFGDIAALFEPHDEIVPVGAGAAAAPAVDARRRPVDARATSRRPIRAATPKPSGPPMWLFALLGLAAVIIAYVLLTSS
jgi:pSer/pThr/pTyr-binding forkhead associated (FHA) protein